MMDIFIRNMHIYASHDLNWWTGVMWIIEVFLSAVWTLILTAPIHCMDPLASKWCNAKFLQICSDEEINSATSCMALGRIHFQYIFLVNY